MNTEKSSIFVYGEVLYDCFEGSTPIIGGAPFNVAWHLQAFGLAPQMITAIGNDTLGEQIINTMEKWGMSTKYVQKNISVPTGTVRIKLKNGEPHYDIRDRCAYDDIQYNAELQTSEHPFIYHGSLALRHSASNSSLQSILKQKTFKRFIDVNLRAPWWDYVQVIQSVQAAEFVKLNIDELKVLTRIDSTSAHQMDADWTAQASEFKSIHKIENVLITRGSEGATLIDAQKGVYNVNCPRMETNVVDTVGAGDAFSAVIIFAQINNWPWPIALDRAQQFASYIVTQQGATCNDPRVYDKFVRNWTACL
ncbi:MAG: fructokinase [Flavobacteriales bacterium]|jgi:fructokinase